MVTSHVIKTHSLLLPHNNDNGTAATNPATSPLTPAHLHATPDSNPQRSATNVCSNTRPFQADHPQHLPRHMASDATNVSNSSTATSSATSSNDPPTPAHHFTTSISPMPTGQIPPGTTWLTTEQCSSTTCTTTNNGPTRLDSPLSGVHPRHPLRYPANDLLLD